MEEILRSNEVNRVTMVEFFLHHSGPISLCYVFTHVCDSVNRGGCLPHYMLGYPLPPRADPPEQTPPPPRADPPRSRQPPLPSRLWHTVNERPVRILLECILVGIFIVFSRTTRLETTLSVLSCNEIDVTFRKHGKKRTALVPDCNEYKVMRRKLNDEVSFRKKSSSW